MGTFEIRHYITSGGRNLFAEWRSSLRDRKACMAIDRRIGRVQVGNFGDRRFCRDGIWELRIDLGPGYRVYYALEGQTVVLLLCAGAKSTQDADIAKAREYLLDWRSRGPVNP
jgi:putative addiction module killer protein